MSALLLKLIFFIYLSNVEGRRFQVQYEWSFVNFTWKSQAAYNNAIKTNKYIPKNTIPSGIKFYKDRLFISMPRMCKGTPVTLGFISMKNSKTTNPLISPYPDWNTNDLTNHTCDKLENVQSMEIDSSGIMWVIDGLRLENSACPPKLLLYDLNKNILSHTFIFPNQISLTNGGYLNDLVVDETNGSFAYITDSGNIDPGLIVYSRKLNRAWKLRDTTIFGQIKYSHFAVDDFEFDDLGAIDGIALGPKNLTGPRTLYYCPLSALNLYSLTTDVLQNEKLCNSGTWRYNVTLVGQKQAQTDGMVCDNTGVLYYGLLSLHAVGRWNTFQKFSKAGIADSNKGTMIWIDSFGFDDQGYLHLMSNEIHRYFVSKCEGDAIKNVTFRLLKYFTGTQSYLF